MNLIVANLPQKNLAFTNKIYLSNSTYSALFPPGATSPIPLLQIHNHIYLAEVSNGVQENEIALNGLQRRAGQLALFDSLVPQPYTPPPTSPLASITFALDFVSKKSEKPKTLPVVNADDLVESFRSTHEMQCFKLNQVIAVVSKEGQKLELTVSGMANSTFEEGAAEIGDGVGQILPMTQITFSKSPGAHLSVEGEAVTSGSGGGTPNSIFTSDFDFNKLGIGGLDKEFSSIFRRAFASRIWPSHIIKQMGINHVRGMLLFGPPGCGKTLIARQIGKALNSREPKIVNGPEILDKFVGGSEEKIRDLFKDAEKEQAEQGEASMLHIIILDEMDAICKSRGTVRDGTGVSDSVVNQLLSKIDGVDSLNNVLLIGMTNRKDMIDDALLRPGRLEVHVEIGLPDEAGRLQILNIHTKPIREAKRLTPEVSDRMEEIASKSKNFSGAEIEGLVKSAASFAFSRALDVNDLSKVPDEKALIVQFGDFEQALGEIEPKFGVQNEEFNSHFKNGIINYGEPGSQFYMLQQTLKKLVNQVRTSEKTPLLSILLEGNPFSGKTAIAAFTAFHSEFPFIRMISADSMIGHSESSKCQAIHKAFLDAYKSPLSLILIDDIERIIEYIRVGPRFNNAVLQTLLVLLKKPPPEGRKLLIMGTTSMPHLLDDLGIIQAFSVAQNVPLLEQKEIAGVLREIGNCEEKDCLAISEGVGKPLGVKQLMLLAEMAKGENGKTETNNFLECLHTVGY